MAPFIITDRKRLIDLLKYKKNFIVKSIIWLINILHIFIVNQKQIKTGI